MIRPMKKLVIAVPKGKEERFLDAVQKLQMIELHQLSLKEGFSRTSLSPRVLQKEEEQIDFLYAELRKTMRVSRLSLTREEEKNLLADFSLEELWKTFHTIADRIQLIEARLVRIKKTLEKVRAFAWFESPLTLLKETASCEVILFSVPFSEESQVRKKFSQDLLFPSKRADRTRAWFLLVAVRNPKRTLSAEIEGCAGKIEKVPLYRRTPSEVIERLESRMRDLEKEHTAVLAKMSRIKKHSSGILVAHDRISTWNALIRAKGEASFSRYFCFFGGWIPADMLSQFEDWCVRTFPDLFFMSEDPSEEDKVPVALVNNPVVKPFEVVVDLYGRPSYTGIDPSGYLAPFFAISFGFCLTDAGYGIILALLSFFIRKKFYSRQALYKFFSLLMYAGIATIGIGAMTGGWFGDLIVQFPSHPLSRILSRAVIFRPMAGGNGTLLFLLTTLVFGYLQLLFGLFLRAVHAVKNRNNAVIAVLACFLQIAIPATVFCAVASQKGICASITVYTMASVTAVAMVWLMFCRARLQQGVMLKIFWAVNGAYEVIAGNLIGDTLSYSRLFGLGLTTNVLAMLIAEMVFLTTSFPIVGLLAGAILFIVGHTINMLLNMFGSYIHSSRLQYLEFFTKFFEGGGRAFRPFEETRTHTFIEQKGI